VYTELVFVWFSAMGLYKFLTDLDTNLKMFRGNCSCIFVCAFDDIKCLTVDKQFLVYTQTNLLILEIFKLKLIIFLSLIYNFGFI
jgi:hypothetical protein